jgi:hypothetical protein
LYLKIKILNGDREGFEFYLSTDGGSKNKLPYLLETESFTIDVTTENNYDSVIMLIDNIEYILRSSDGNRHSLKPVEDRNGHYEKLFLNYFGVSNIVLLLTNNDSTITLVIEPIEILARKLTAAQTEAMIEYILNESNGDLYQCFSPTSLASSYSSGGLKPELAVAKLRQLIDIVDDILPAILVRPISKLVSSRLLKKGNATNDLGETGSTWVLENLCVLEETNDVDLYHLKHDDKMYYANEVQTLTSTESTDTYENQALHGFFDYLKRIIHELEDEFEAKKVRLSGNMESGYISFFSAMQKWVGPELEKPNNELRCYSQKINKIVILLKKHVPVSKIGSGTISFTQKAKRNRSYSAIFRAITEWYTFNKIDWRSHDLLLSIQSIPKLFEYYTVLRVKNALELITSPITELPNSESLMKGIFHQHLITLYYEPKYWCVGHKNGVGDLILNTESKGLEKAFRGKAYKPSSHKNSNRSPDIVIEIENTEGNDKNLIIMDAKYTAMKSAFKKYLPDCTMKYIHGISYAENGISPKAMVILCPNSSDSFADYHLPPYGLYEDKSVFPILGAQGISLLSSGKNYYSIESTIKELLSKINSVKDQKSELLN